MKWYVHKNCNKVVGQIVWACLGFRVRFEPELQQLLAQSKSWVAELSPIPVDYRSSVTYVIDVPVFTDFSRHGVVRYFPQQAELPQLVAALNSRALEGVMNGDVIHYGPPAWGPITVAARPPAWPAQAQSLLARLAQLPKRMPKESARRADWLATRLGCDGLVGEGFSVSELLEEARLTRTSYLAADLGISYYVPPTAVLFPVWDGVFTVLGQAIVARVWGSLRVSRLVGHAKLESQRPAQVMQAPQRTPEGAHILARYAALYAGENAEKAVGDALLEGRGARAVQVPEVLEAAQGHPAFELRRRRGFAGGTVLYERRLLGSVVDYVAVRGTKIGRGVTPRQALEVNCE